MPRESEWTIETAMAHLLALREADQRAVLIALASQKEAVLKAEAASERRFESVNEFRAALADQQRTFIPRAEVEVLRNASAEKLDALTHVIERMQAERQGLKGGWGYAVGVVGLVATVLAMVSFFVGR